MGEPRMGTAGDRRHEGGDDGMVSLLAEVPEPLLLAMRQFIDQHPNWDQYRLFQAALAGFLVQHAAGDRSITRCYLANLFPGSGRFQSPVMAGRDLRPADRSGERAPERSGERPRLRVLPRPPASAGGVPYRSVDPSSHAA